MKLQVGDLLDQAPTISVGLLAADPMHFGDALADIAEAGALLVHVDVMDGGFCPQVTAGPWLAAAIPDRFVKDVHLMVDDPLRLLSDYVDAGAGIITFDVATTRHPHRVLQALGESGILRGVSISPSAPLTVVEPLLDEIDVLTILAVNPGWRGQHLLPATESRVLAARSLLDGRECVLALDGGVTHENVGVVASFGVDVIVAGSAIFSPGHPPGCRFTSMRRQAHAGCDKGESVQDREAL